MTPPVDLYDRILSELEGVTFEEDLASTYPSDEDLQFLSDEDARGDEEGWAA